MKECYVNLDYKETQKCSDIHVFYSVPSMWQSSFTLYQLYLVPSTWQINLTNTPSQTWYPQHDKVVSQTLYQLNLLNGSTLEDGSNRESSILSIINDLSLNVLSILFLACRTLKRKKVLILWRTKMKTHSCCSVFVCVRVRVCLHARMCVRGC